MLASEEKGLGEVEVEWKGRVEGEEERRKVKKWTRER